MANPQRYGASAAPCDTGIFVMHADYEKVVAECDALKHDLASYMHIAQEYLEEIEELRAQPKDQS